MMVKIMNRKLLSVNKGTALAGLSLPLAPLAAVEAARLGNATVLNAANGVTINVQSLNKTMSEGRSVLFWVWGAGGGMGGCNIAGPTLELGVGQQLNVNLGINMMTPQENPPYHGHTIHWHGLDVLQSEDGVPETGAAVLGANYKFTVDSRHVGGSMY